MTANGVKIKIDGDDSGFRKSLAGVGDIAKKGLGTALKGIAVGTAAAATAIGALGTQAIKAYADYEQLTGGVETLFNKFDKDGNKVFGASETVMKNAANAYKTAGMSANEYMTTVTGYAASLKQSFADTAEGIKQAADTADMAAVDMADNANKMGTPLESIQLAYQGFAKQNYTMLDNLKLGYGGTKEEMQRLLAEAQKLSGVKYDISNLADVYNAVHVIQGELGITGTTAKEASTTISGSLGMVKAAWTNLAAGIADDNADFDALIDNFVNSVLTAGENIMPRVEKVLQGIGELIAVSAKEILPVIINTLMTILPDLIEAAGSLVQSLGDALPDMIRGLIPCIISVLGELIAALIAQLPQITAAIADAFGDAVPMLKPITNIIHILANNLKELIPVVLSVVAVIGVFKAAMLIQATIQGVVTAVNAFKKANEAATISQAALNAVMNMNPIALLITLLGALAAAIGVYTVASNIASGATANLNKSYDEAIQRIDDNTNAEFAQAEQAEYLKNKLYDLEDQIKSGTLSDEDAATAKNEFKVVSEDLDKMIPGLIDNIGDETNEYSIQRGEVDLLTESFIKLTKAKALAAAYEEKMKKAQETIIEADKKINDPSNSPKSKLFGLKVYDNSVSQTFLKARNALTGNNDFISNGVIYSGNKELEDAIYAKAQAQKDLDGFVSDYAKAVEEITSLTTNGAKKGSDNVSSAANSSTKSVSTAADKATKSTKKAADKQVDIAKEQQKKLEAFRDKEFEDLEFLHNMERISDSEYYGELAKLRGKYFEVGSKEWQQYTEKIYQYTKQTEKKIEDNVDELNKKAQNKLEDLANKQKSLADKFKGELKLYDETSVTLPNINGKTATFEGIGLKDLSEQTNDLLDFSNALNTLKGKADIPDELFSQMRDMSQDGRKKFVDELLALSPEDLQEYINNWKQYQSASDSVASTLFGGDKEKLKSEIEDEFGQVPEGFFDIGEESGIEFKDGFMSKIKNMFAEIKNNIIADLSNLTVGAGLAAAANGITGSVAYNNISYNLLPGKGESTAQQLATVRQNQTLNALRGGY